MYAAKLLKHSFLKIVLFHSLILSCGGSSLFAIEYLSNGSGNWSSSTTWTPSGIPTINDNVTVRNGDIVTVDMNAFCNNLIITGRKCTLVDALNICLGYQASELRLGAYLITVGGAFTNNSVFNSNTGTVKFTGSGNISGSEAVSFYRLTIDAPDGTITLQKNISVSNMLTMTSGTFATGTYTMNGTAGITATGGTLSLAKLTTVPELPGTYNITGGTVFLNGAGDQTIRGGTYNDIAIGGGSGTKTLGEAIILNGDLNIISSSLDVSSSKFDITISGDWMNTGTFIDRSGTVTFTGTTTITGYALFNNVVITGVVTGHPELMTVSGSWVNNGTFNHNNGTIVFFDSTAVSGSSVTNLNNVLISGTLIGHPVNIGVAGNWTNNGTFNHNNGTVTFNSTDTLQALSGATAFNHLTLNNTANNLTLESPISVNGILTLTSGQIITSSTNILTMNSGATTTTGNVSSYINGPMKYKVANSGSLSVNLPIGKGSSWRPATLTVDHTNTSSVTYTAEVLNTSARNLGYAMPAEITKVSDVRIWRINRENVSNLNNATVQLFYGEDDGVTDSPNLRILKTIGNDLAWYNVGGVGSANGSGSITSDPFTSFSDFTPGNEGGGGNALPIELLDFVAKSKNNQVEIAWTTASEVNNDYFTLEKTADGKNYETITKIKGAGNSNFIINYTTIDPKPLTGVSYYRLKQTDFNGKYSYSDLVSVSLENFADFIVYPNPSDGVRISASVPGIEAGTIVTITDINGKERFFREITFEEIQKQVLDIKPEEKLESGVYLIDVKFGQKNYKKRILIK